MVIKQKLLASLIGIAFSAQAQIPIYNSTIPDVNSNTASQSIKNTGVSVSPKYGLSKMMAATWDEGGPIRAVTYDLNGILPSSGGFVTVGWDPDIEFSLNGDRYFLCYADSTAQLRTYTDTGGGVYTLSNGPILQGPNMNVGNINLDYTFDATGIGIGAITWNDAAGSLYARAFDPSGSPSGPMVTFPYTNVTQPDIALCADDNQYYITFLDGATGKLVVIQGAYTSLVGGSAATSGPTNVLAPDPGYSFRFPRIATPKNLVNFNSTDYTVAVRMATPNPSPIYSIRGFSKHNTVVTTLGYEISVGAGSSFNGYPTVTYNSDRVKFFWAAEYDNGVSNWIQTPTSTSPTRDVLCAEFKWDNNHQTMINYYTNGRLFEINNTLQINPGIPSNDFGLTAIGETRDVSTSTTNPDYNIFLYYDQLNHDLYHKYIPNSAAPKRMGVPTDNTMLSTIRSNNVYTISGENLNQFHFTLYNTKGQSIELTSKLSYHGDDVIVDLSGLSPGLYLLNAFSNNQTHQIKLISGN